MGAGRCAVNALQPLLARDRYSDEEWGLASAGLCGMDVANYPDLEHCRELSSSGSFYRFCAEHDEEARSYPTYGK